MDYQRLIIVLVYLHASLKEICHGLHFRGSMISWRVVNDLSTPLVVEILQRHAWRLDRFLPICSDTTIPSGAPILGDVGASLNCILNCPSGVANLGSVRVPCTGFNTGEQYAMGEGRFTVSIPENSSFIASFSSSAWFPLVTGNNLPWSVAVQIQTFRRTDTGRYNNAPIITMLPIYRLRNLVSYSIKINVADNDFDPYICLWSIGSDQCGGLSNSVPGGAVDNYGCYVNFTPSTAGFYAVAVTTEDFVTLPTNLSSSEYLSQVPIQFIFHVYDSPDPCFTGPIYIGDLVPDICIYMPIGATYTTRVRFQVQCTNASVDSVISANPTGLLTTPLQQDTFDPTIYAFLANFTSNAQQIGQNLFCFSAVDSIGNQGDSACLRFTISSQTSSLQPLYIHNATRYPTGTVPKTTSEWTILTGSRVYIRPSTEAYVRFRRASDNVDFHVINAVTALDRVQYFIDRIVINSSAVWTPGESFYIYFDAGVLVEANTCSKEAMPISDPSFWPFDVPYETTTTSTTSTTTTSVSSTTTMRTVPTRRALITVTQVTSSTTTEATSTSTSTAMSSTTTARMMQPLSISAIVGIILATLLVSSLFIWIVGSVLRIAVIRFLLLETGLHQQLLSIRATPMVDSSYSDQQSTSSGKTVSHQYKLATRSRPRKNFGKYSTYSEESSLEENLVEIRA